MEGLGLATIVKMNDVEWEMLCDLGVNCATPEDLVREYGLDVLAVTEGEKGASLYSARGERATAQGCEVVVVDTVGAGDAFTAVTSGAICRCFVISTTDGCFSQIACGRRC